MIRASRWSCEMHPAALQDRIYRGLNSAARAIGVDTDAYRPSGPIDPLAPTNRFLRLRAAFTARDSKFAHPVGYGEAIWYGMFDAVYTRPGDYLVQEAGVWFIAAQQRLLPVLCVEANRTISITRPPAPPGIGVNAYSGTTAAGDTPLLTNWPASVLGAAGRGHPEADLPSDTSIPYWTVLLPAFPSVVLRPADLINDDIGRNGVIVAAELTQLGWRITVKQATT